MKKRFAVGGAVLGVGWGLYALVTAYMAAPGMPGPHELIIQLVLLGVPATFGAVGGFIAGWLVHLVLRKKG
jgi:hypothetical protein